MEKNFSSIRLGDEYYPLLLKEIAKPPKELHYIGTLPPADMMAVAIVGTRKATTQGKLFAKKIAHDLAKQGIIIVSGLALGIDTVAHEGAIEANGVTMAVLSDGIETVYPSRNAALADKVLSLGGILLSEYRASSPYYPGQFIQRNRIISGLCVATIVVEAPERSGTLATARFALEQGREVFVIPGPVDHPNYTGSHQLIRDGARLVTSAKDVYEDLGVRIPGEVSTGQMALGETRDPNETMVVEALTKAGKSLSVDKIAELTTMDARAINTTIASLVMEGIVKETEHGYTI
ncbi:MAG: protecting protein DprA protein [Candidatus Wolfebacteria bacterium GW2011_GWE1_48_7]|nr:MAG: protecting protein DprA protein [Candidatus Wolfebacteria bacterium GW2011_GWC2_46_275]KKU41990.1 MAG: protecting protein DprA protein [Candidatus Wolfebacteria bacterium GW2011_GWB2_46_69]KKU54474.1 MAG: protecting protein DprA protein [Candidatus Wolfebacteria bacterium GW2011_GWC1_47_103]KKU59801.1 MAG: protecting protein DprA protein [Candidatus Wolfebacteria bacterium GW2011_GWE2_47_12]KKU65794.1 MAG: protecting protein DprA protein [Candidatus Wolfebacteria bacterium GW2011_GWD2_4